MNVPQYSFRRERGGLAHRAPAAPSLPSAVSAAAGAEPAKRTRGAWSPAAVWRSATVGVEWTPVYIGFLVYMFTVITYRLPLAQTAIGFSLCALLLQRERFRFSSVFILLGVFLVWCGVGYTQTEYADAVYKRMEDMLKLWLIVLVGVNALRTRAQVRFYFIFCLACFALYPTRGAYFNFFLYNASMAGRAVWNYVYANPNDLAAQTLLWLAVSAGVLMTERKGSIRTLAIVGVVALTLLVFMTQSRGGILALAPLALGALSYSKNQRLRTIVMFGAIGLALVMFAPSSVWDRLRGLEKATDTTRLNEVDSSAEQRYEIWKVARKVISEHPVFGVGAGAYSSAHGVYSVRPEFKRIAWGNRDTHSTYLGVTAETGFVGMTLFVVMFAVPVAYAERVRRRVAPIDPSAARQLQILELGLAAFFTAGIFGSFSHLNVTYLYTLSLWALTAAVDREVRPGAPALGAPRTSARGNGRGNARIA